MNSQQEFDKIRTGFVKVKEDINYLNLNIEKVKTQKADRVTTDHILMELNKLRQIIIEMSLKETKVEVGEKLNVIGNLDSKKVHYSNCPFAKRITIEHRTSFDSVADALNHKYNKCSCVL